MRSARGPARGRLSGIVNLLLSSGAREAAPRFTVGLHLYPTSHSTGHMNRVLSKRSEGSGCGISWQCSLELTR